MIGLGELQPVALDHLKEDVSSQYNLYLVKSQWWHTEA